MTIPDQVKTALERLNAAGHETYVVGGAVRDLVRGSGPVRDWDLATAALPEQTEAVFRDFPLIETGLKHGTVTVLLDGMPLEITTFRVDGAYTDHRRPDGVRFTGRLEEDLARRDFTINAMAWSPQRGLVDPFGGSGDIRRGLIRCVGTPERRFQEDALRILRALRFSSELRFAIEKETAAALRRQRELLGAVAAERVHSELTRLLCGPGAEEVLLKYGDVLAVPIPELAPMFGFQQHNSHHDRDVWAHTAAVVGAVPPRPVLRWAALLHDVGKPECFTVDEKGTGHFYGHARRGAELADAVLSRLRFDTRSRERIVELVRRHDAPIPPEEGAVKHLLNRMGPEGTEELIALHRADTLGQSPLCHGRLADYDRAEELRRALLERAACFSLKNLAVNGRDLLALGLRGPAVGRGLDACLDAVMDGRVPNRREELLMLLKNKHA